MAAAALASIRCIVRNDGVLHGEIACAEPTRRARLLFGGDLMQHMPQVEAARRENGFDYSDSFGAVEELFRSADFAALNLETTLRPTGPYSGYPCFRSPAALAGKLARMGVDAALLANNHCCDGGSRGIASTVRALEEVGVAHTGVFADSTDYNRNRILRFERGGIRFALLNYTYGTNGIPVPEGRIVHLLDTAVMARDLALVGRDRPDCIIACVHWGEEYARRPNAAQRAAARFLRSHGVDLVVGSHPHVVQPYEGDAGGFTLYSLGNLVSNQRKRYTDGGLLAVFEAVRYPGGRMEYALDLIPVWVALPHYRILTPQAADTALLDPFARERCNRFFRDTEELLCVR